MKRLFKTIVLALCIVMGLMATACTSFGPVNKPVNNTKIGGKIRVWTRAPLIHDYRVQLRYDPDNKQAKFAQAIVDGFENKYKDSNVEVELIESSWGVDLNKDLMLGIQGNTLPDIVAGEQFVRPYVMNQHFQKLEFSENYNIIPQAEAVGKLGSSWYAVPVWTGTLALCINKNVLHTAGVIDRDNGDEIRSSFLSAITAAPYNRSADINPLAPATWEDLLAICRYIKDYYNHVGTNGDKYSGGMLLSATKDGSAWRALGYMRTAGGELADSAEQVMLMDDKYKDANVKAMNMMRSLAETSPADSLASLNEEQIWKLFFNNKAAYIVEGIDAVTRSTRDGVQTKAGDVVACELPVYEENGKKSNVLIGTVYYSITKNCQNYATAMAFLEYLMSEEVQLMVMEQDMRIPTRTDILGGEAIKETAVYDTMKPFLAPIQKEEYSFSGGIPSFSTRNSNPSKIWETWDSMISDVLTTKNDITTILQNAHNSIKGNL